MIRTAPIALVLGLALALPVRVAAEPECVAKCMKLETEGQLRDNVSAVGCKMRVCQEEGRRFYEQAEYDRALESLDAVLMPLKTSPSYAFDRALLLYALGRFDEALEFFDTAKQTFPDSVRLRAQRGHTLVRLKRFADAESEFSQTLEVPGAKAVFRGIQTESYLRGNVGVARVLGGDPKGGRKAFEQALESDQKNSQAYLWLNEVLPALDEGRLDRDGAFLMLSASEDAGIRQYERAANTLAGLLDRAPKFAPPYFLQAEILVEHSKFKLCADALARGVKALPDDIDLHAEQIRCHLLDVGVASEAAAPAIAELERLRKEHPDNLRVWQILHMLDRS